MSAAAWGFLSVFVTQAVILTGLFVRQGRQGVSVAEINRAVNHQPKDAPTLVERVGVLEGRTEELATHGRAHRDWEHQALNALAFHVGCVLPPHPKEQLTTEGN